MTAGLTFNALRRANRQRQDEWDPNKTIDPLYRATELAGEMGAALNVVKKLERERRGIAGSRATKDDLRHELADVLICLDLLAEEYGIDLGEATREKFNATSQKVGLTTRL
jgi:NTP pyrophosphatase (non-canonical NTP hydrolase)